MIENEKNLKTIKRCTLDNKIGIMLKSSNSYPILLTFNAGETHKIYTT